MITRTPVSALAVLLTLWGASATADPITLTSGVLIAEETVALLHLEGLNGFRLDAGGSAAGGIFPIWQRCADHECKPGQTVPLTAAWDGKDFAGSATVDGITFDLGLQTLSNGSMVVEFAGSFTAPPFSGHERVSVFAPFTFGGSIDVPDGLFGFEHPNQGIGADGTAQVNLSWNASGGSWVFNTARYEFETASAVPEPATLLLVSSAILGVTAARRRHVKRKPGITSES
jgi:hypothetical protein